MFKSKKIITVLLSAIMVLSVGFSAFAFENVSTENVGVSYEKPFIQDSRPSGTKPPKKSKVWDVSKKDYELKGQAANNELYTSYWITGQKSYKIKVKNKKSSLDKKLKVKVYKYVSGWFKDPKRIKSDSIIGQKTKTIEVKGLDKDDLIYVKFYAPCHFEGKIK